MKLSVLLGVVFGVALTASGAFGEVEVIDFAELPAGTIVSEVYGSGGTGPVHIFGLNPRMSESVNAAVIFDSAHPTGEDPDLGAPNETFEIDGQPGPGRGVGGLKDTPHQNAVPLGKLLIIAEDLVDADGDGLVDDPDDMAHRANLFTMDFSEVGPVTIHRMTLIDVESNEGRPVARLMNADGQEIRTVALPVTGDNGMTFVDFGPTSGVSKMTVSLGGSGAISSFRFEVDPPPVIAVLPQTASRLPLVLLTAALLICLGGALLATRQRA
jgi:hypothetical protein